MIGNGLLFDPASHTYTRDGVLVMHVTRPLRDLKGLENVPRDNLEVARERGSMADRAIQLYIDNNLREETLDPVLVPYLAGWKKAVARYGLRVVAKQQMVYHGGYRYAGTYDVVAEMDHPPKHIVGAGRVMTEVKCVDSVDADVGLQLAAYAEAYNWELDQLKDSTTPRVRHRLALRLLRTGDFSPTWYTERSDFMVFVGCLYRTNWRITHEYEPLRFAND